MTGKIFFKLIAAVLCLLVVALVAVDFFASKVAESTYLETLERELVDKGRMLALVVPSDRAQFTRYAQAARGRLTLIARDGRVLADSEAPAERMENHANRSEVQSALAGRAGSVRRQSPTLGVPFLYVAVPVGEGALRLAVPLAEIQSQVDAIRRRMLASTALAFVPAILLAALFARWVSRRLGLIIEYSAELAKGNFQARLATPGRDELGLLERKLNETGQTLEGMFQELEREHAELEKLERVRKDFVINVSHELRTPLASIQGYTETLLDGAIHEPEHNVRFLGIIRQNAERLANLTADLLTLSRVELKQQKFQFASYLVDELVQSTVDSMLPLARRKNITIAFSRCPARPEAFCDAEAVNQVLTNLVDNALKYTPENGTIQLGVRQLSPQPFVEVYVKDSGIGIPQEDLPRLFERFYRVDKARSRELGGTGLGLAIVKHLVRAQGGEVRVTSVVGQGSEFSFTLPHDDLGMSEQSDIRSQLMVS
ncbi:MAG: HAMP domain-containing protein [Acidobacteria bacterium]|nr:HAMP domain-containing protein [Bryobacteraceae bacterium CoA2 C42]